MFTETQRTGNKENAFNTEMAEDPLNFFQGFTFCQCQVTTCREVYTERSLFCKAKEMSRFTYDYTNLESHGSYTQFITISDKEEGRGVQMV